MRKSLIERRLSLLPAERAALSQWAQAHLIQQPAFGMARVVLLYWAIRGEVLTEQIAVAANGLGKQLVLPRVQMAPRGLTLHAWSGNVSELKPNAYGILEPELEWPTVKAEEIELAIVPGVAFDSWGNRLGYGGGYYDRTLPLLREANPFVAVVGLAYHFQLVALLPRTPHDALVDGVVTERGYLCSKPAGSL